MNGELLNFEKPIKINIQKLGANATKYSRNYAGNKRQKLHLQ